MDSSNSTGGMQESEIQAVDSWDAVEFIKILGFFPHFRCLGESPDLKAKNGKCRPVSIQERHGSPEQRLELARKYNKLGYGIFWVPPDCGETGQERLQDIKAIRTVTLDLDDVDYRPVLEFPIKPSVIVCTSPKSYHCTWVLDKPVPIAEFSCSQYTELARNIGSFFGADDCYDACHLFRMPGFKHLKGEPHEARIIYRGTKGNRTSLSSLVRGVKSFTISNRQACKQVMEPPEKGNNLLQGERGHNDSLENESSPMQGKRNYKTSGSSDSRNCRTKEVANEIDLGEVIAGNLKVTEGCRHRTILRLYIKLLEAGEKPDDVWNKVDEIIEKSFDKPWEYREGGKNFSDTLKLRRDAIKTYIPANKAERDAKALESLKDLDRQIEDFEKDPERFEYDFSGGTLKYNKYSERGVAERVLQRFNQDIVRLGRRTYCFNMTEKIWYPQLQAESSYSELDARVTACLKDVIQERDFTDKFKSKKGELNLHAKQAREEMYFKATSTSAISKIVMNHIALPKLEWKDFDADPDMFYFANGVLNMRTLEFREARNEDRLLCRSGVVWKGINEKCPNWDIFLSEIFAESDEPKTMIDFMWTLYAYTMAGRIEAQKIFCHTGGGGNGKSRNLNAIRLLLGGYGAPVGSSDLVIKANSFTKHFERIGAKVEGKRGAIVDDSASGIQWNDEFLKALTGKEFEARAEYERSRVVTNRCKFHIALNHKPAIADEDESLVRRLCFIPYLCNFDNDEEAGERIDSFTAAEISGIAAKAVLAYRGYLSVGKLLYPKECLEASEVYRKEQFKGEALICEMFEPGTDEALDWHTSAELLSDISKEVGLRGDMRVPISTEILSRILTKSVGVNKPKKRWSKTEKNMIKMYFVKHRAKNESE